MTVIENVKTGLGVPGASHTAEISGATSAPVASASIDATPTQGPQPAFKVPAGASDISSFRSEKLPVAHPASSAARAGTETSVPIVSFTDTAAQTIASGTNRPDCTAVENGTAKAGAADQDRVPTTQADVAGGGASNNDMPPTGRDEPEGGMAKSTAEAGTANQQKKRFEDDENKPEILGRKENKTFISERFQGGDTFFTAMGEDVLDVYVQVFPMLVSKFIRGSAGIKENEIENIDPRIEAKADEIIDEELFQDVRQLTDALKSPDTKIVVLRDKETQTIVGFNYFTPLVNSPQTVDLGHIAILKDFRGQGGWSLLMDNTDEGIVEDGRYTTMECYALKDGHVADRVRARYKEGIVKERPSLNMRLGQQRAFTIALDRLHQTTNSSRGAQVCADTASGNQHDN